MLRRWTALVIGLSFVPGLSAVAQNADVTVYVFTAKEGSGFTDVNQAARADALTHLKAELDRKKTIAVVDDPRAADFTMEILGSARKETGNERTTGSGPGLFGTISRTTKEKHQTIHAILIAGEYTLQFEGSAPTRMKQAAGAVADGVEKWVKQNRKLLEERRRQR